LGNRSNQCLRNVLFLLGMELTKYELTPYLPYDLKFIGKGANKEIQVLTGIRNDAVLIKFNSVAFGDIEDILPILRPLSDLIPNTYDEYNVVDGIEDSILITMIESLPQHCDAYDEWMESYFDNPEPSRILQAPYEFIQVLFEQHYDVFDLISQGLAIDINTLKTP